MKKVFLFFLFPLLALQLCGQHRAVSRAQAVADIDSLVLWISQIHPDMFAVCPEKVFQKSIRRVKAALPDSLDQIEFYKRVTPCITQLGDGHTSLSIFRVEKDSRVLPFMVNMEPRDTTFRVQGNDSIRILRINGMPVREIATTLLPYVSGESLAFRLQRLQGIFPLLFPVIYPDSLYCFTLQKGDSVQDKKLKCVSYQQLQLLQGRNRKKPSAAARQDYAYRLIPEKNALLFEFNSLHNAGRFRVFADSMFREIQEKDIRNLIIDIRDNGGGDSKIGDELMQYISHVPFVQFGKAVVRLGPLPRFRTPAARYAVDTTFSWEAAALTPLRGEPLRLPENKRVYLLISNATFSSAASFSWAFKYFKMGTVVGEETGGQSVSFGDVQSFVLPHSQLRGSVSFKRFYHYGADDRHIHGTLPDIRVPSSEALDYVLKELIP